MVDARRRALAVGRAGQALHLQVHHAVGDVGHHLPEEIVVGALLNERLQGHSVDRHGPFSWLRLVSQPEPTSIRTMTASPLAPLWTSWGKGFKGRRSPAGLRPTSAQRPNLVSYTTPGDANSARRRGLAVAAATSLMLRHHARAGGDLCLLAHLEAVDVG